jgi:hypothetical protein
LLGLKGITHLKRIPLVLLEISAFLLTYSILGKAFAQSTLDPALAFALSSSDQISLGVNSTVNGSVGALKNLTLGGRSSVTTNADSLGELTLRGFAKVGGACASLTQPKVLHSASCNTVQVGPTSPAILPLQTLSTSGVSYCPGTGTSSGAINLKRNATTRIMVSSPVNSLPTVLDYRSIKLGNGAVLTIGGASDGLVVINISGILKLGTNATITTDNVLPVSSILIIADKVQLGRRASVSSTVFTAGSCDLGVAATINGQLYCKSRVSLAKNATINETQLDSAVAMGVTCSIP